MLKRLTFFLSILLVIGLVIGVGWFVRYRNSVPQSTTETENGPPGSWSRSGGKTPSSTTTAPSSTVSVSVGKPFGMVADQTVLAYHAFEDGSVIFIQPSGQIVRVSGNEGIVLSSLALANLQSAAFSYDGKRIAAAFGNSLNRQLGVFDVDKKSWSSILARPISPPLWAPKDYRLAFLTADQNNNSIVTVVDTQVTVPKTQDVLTTAGQDLRLFWKSDNELFLSEKPSAFSTAQLWSLHITKKTLTPILRDWPGLDVLWDTAVQQGVVFQANHNGLGGKMVLVGADGSVVKQFAFVSLPGFKCALNKTAPSNPGGNSNTSTLVNQLNRQSAAVLLCAVPKDTSKFLGGRLPDDYLQNDTMTDDLILEAELGTGNILNFSSQMTEVVDATLLQTTSKEIYFVNRYNNKLYRLVRP